MAQNFVAQFFKIIPFFLRCSVVMMEKEFEIPGKYQIIVFKVCKPKAEIGIILG